MKKMLAVLLLISAYSTMSFAGRVCRTLGFSMRDGMAIPVVECSGVDMDSAIMSSFGGGSPSSWGMSANRGSFKLSKEERFNSNVQNENHNATLFSPPTVKSLSSPQNSSDIKNSLDILQRNFQDSLIRHKSSLAEIEKIYTQASNASMAQQQARQAQIGGLVAGYVMQQQLIRIKIFEPMRAQIEFEKKFERSINEEFEKVEMSLLESLNEGVEEIDSNEDLAIGTDLKRMAIDKKMISVAEQIKDRAIKHAEFADAIPVIVDASLGMIASGDNVQKAQGVSAISLALASTNALADGKVEIARSYANAATTALDIGLGFVPVVSSVNDLTQIAFGIATGRDYTGAEMSGIDYGIRAFGVVIGLIPGANLGKIAINAGFLRGAKFLRSAPQIISVVAHLRSFGNKFGTVVEVAGHLLPTGIRDLAEVVRLRALLPSLFSHSQDIIQRLPEEKASLIFRVLSDQTVSMQDRWEVLRSFEVGTINVISVSKGTSLFRWTSNGELGRYFSLDLISDQLKAREMLALPSSNSMGVLNEYRLTTDAEAISGRVAKYFGHEGGGNQLFLKSGSLELVRTVK